MFKALKEGIKKKKKYFREPQCWEKRIRNSCTGLGVPDIRAGVSWNASFILVKLPSNVHLRCCWTCEALQKDCLSQGHMVHLKSSPPACPEEKKKGKKELDRRLTLNKHPAGNTFLVIVNSPTKKQQQQKQKSHTNNNPSIWTNHPSNHSGTAETGRALQSPLQQFAVSFQSMLDLKNNFMQVAPKFLCATLIKSKNSFVLARWASLCILKCAPFLWSS